MQSDCWYDTSQICLNGHLINKRFISSPQQNQNFCKDCGRQTITNCQFCQTSINGHYHIPGTFLFKNEFQIPKFCQHCGMPYPWTESALKAAQNFADQLENLTREEREVLKQSIDDLVTNTPNVEAAAWRFKNLVAKSGVFVADTFHKILVNIISETVKKSIWPS